jgi:hypothetical protein
MGNANGQFKKIKNENLRRHEKKEEKGEPRREIRG